VRVDGREMGQEGVRRNPYMCSENDDDTNLDDTERGERVSLSDQPVRPLMTRSTVALIIENRTRKATEINTKIEC
jgi:hypothetical protein